PDYRAAVGTDLVEPRPSGNVAQTLHRGHPREHARPDLVQEKRLAVVVEMITGRLVGRRVAGEDVRAFVVKVHAGGIDDHAVVGEIELAIVDDADLAANRLGPVAE